jgi:hypothetical protein
MAGTVSRDRGLTGRSPRAVGRLQVNDAEHDLACQLDLDIPGPRPGDPQRVIATSWVIDSR